jgi:hypothetical protein
LRKRASSAGGIRALKSVFAGSCRRWTQRPATRSPPKPGPDEHKRRTKDAGFDQHLTKPADRAALEAILRRPAGRLTRAPQGGPESRFAPL